MPGIVVKCRVMHVEEPSLMKVLLNREELKEVRKQSKLTLRERVSLGFEGIYAKCFKITFAP